MAHKSKAPAVPARALVVGMGVSGKSVCDLLLQQGVKVTATDLRPRDQFHGALDELEAAGCFLRLGMHDISDFLTADQIIISPGVPLDLHPLREAFNRGIEVVGEMEWAWRQVDIPVVAVTGTNGKTTTTSLIGEMLKASGRSVFVGGNIGTPLSKWVLRPSRADVLVLEVSSFQLDTASQFRPDVGVLLNITEDHLDRYTSFDEYANSKLSLFYRQSSEQIAIINADDSLCRARCHEVPGRLWLSSRTDSSAQATIIGREVRVQIDGQAPFMLALDRCFLRGVHNEENILTATLAATAMGVPPSTIQNVIESYRGLPHRLEWVRNWKGVDFYDDSKGTNVGAVFKALENFDRPVLLLLGGRDKLGSYEPLLEPLKRVGKGVFAFGESAPRISKAFGNRIPTLSFSDLPGALKEAVDRAEPGDAVLLSPACSSFDQYESYAQRGDHFKRLVNELE